MMISDRIDEEIYELGGTLIDSDFLKLSKTQTHHGRTTLYNHVMDVTREAVKLCDRYEGIISIDREAVILGALCHDLGMIGRYEKYSNNFQSLCQHPMESARIAREYFPEMSDEIQNIIEKHMWPMTLVPPTHVEEWIVTWADKKVSVKDASYAAAGMIEKWRF